MGAYVNPPSGTKEEWLQKNAIRMDSAPVNFDEIPPGSLPVAVVDNGPFTSAGICFDPGELAEFRRPDGRPRQWFMAKIEDLKTVSNLEQYLKAD